MPKKINVVNLSQIKDAEESHNETNNDEQQLNEIKEEIAKEEESKPIEVAEEDKPLEEVKPKSDTSIISLIKEDIKPSTNESNNQCSKRRSSASLSKHTELTDNNLEKKTGLFENHLLNYMGELR